MRAKLRERKTFLKGFAEFCHNSMERAEEKGVNDLEEQEAIRKYLLGALSNKAEMRKIEEKILLDDDFAEKLIVAEDQLIDEYLDGALPDSEQKKFNELFLKVPERKQKLRLIRDLRKYAANSETQTVRQFKKEKSVFFDWRRLISLPSFRLAAAALLVLLFGFIIWRTVIYQSDVDKGLAQLQLINPGQRVTESRTTLNSGYAPIIVTRGGDEKTTNEQARERAARYLFDATANTTDAKAHHGLGLYYLIDKQFDKALGEFDIALKSSGGSAKIYSDIGATYLEKAKLARIDKKDSEVQILLDASKQNIDRALELDPNLLEALFNKALVLQKTPALIEARAAWEKYLEKDSASEWADEARRQIQQIDSQKSQSLSSDELEKAFLLATRSRNDAEAGNLISRNRELIKQKYLPQKLAMSFVKASAAEREEYLQALSYAGELEEKNTGDSFAKDLAAFYAKLSDANLESLKQAQEAMQSSYAQYLKGDDKNAYDETVRARQIFLQTGDACEAKLSELLMVYYRINNDQTGESIKLGQELSDFCRRNNYKWLLSYALYWLAGGQRSAGDRTNAKANYKECLTLAKEIGDAQIYQKILVTYAKQNKFVGQNQEALGYLQKAFDAIGSAQGLPRREKWRTYSESIEILSSLKLYSLAKAVSLESIRLADEEGDVSFIADAALDAGIAHAQAGDFEEARKWLGQAKQRAEALPESNDRMKNLAQTLLTSGYLERKLGNHAQAAEFYDQAFRVVENKKTPYYLYEIEKARLLTDISLNRDAEAEEKIAKTIDLAENYRTVISDAQENSSFFNNQQDIFDIAVNNEFKHARYEQAYNLLEKSNSRALLNWLRKGINVKKEKENVEITFKETAQPQPLEEIRAQMPERVQILQYAVLENKVLICLVSKDNFAVVPTEIGFEELKEKVTAYAKLISNRNAQKQEEAKTLARELYDLLVAPVAAQLDASREICVIPQKILFHLPFAALTAPDGKSFLSKYNFFYASSANVFLLFSEKAKQKSGSTNESLLSVGNPRFDANEFKELADLPEAEDEARAIRQFYTSPQTVLIGAQATQEAVESALKDAEVINFAGHYLVKNGAPLDSGLVLTKPDGSANTEDNILTNRELISRTMPQAKLVVLSACGTGVEQYYNGEGLVGLSNTFLKAGAPLVVATQWQVDSGAAAVLMKKFHQYRRQEKMTTTAALRRAQLEMAETSNGQFSQPYFWATFATYGGYAEF
jgi:CHAT domain-containing protein